MAELLLRAHPVSVANHVKARRSLIERDWLLSLAELEVKVPPFAVVSSAEASLFLGSVGGWSPSRNRFGASSIYRSS